MPDGLIGIKMGMTQVFDGEGNFVPVTVIKAGPCIVTQRKTVQKDGYDAVQVGLVEARKAKRVTRPRDGHFKKAGVPPTRMLREFQYSAIEDMKVGDQVLASRFADIRPGNSLPLQYIPSGTLIHNIELRKGKGGQLVRSAGVAARLTAKEGDYVSVKLPSGEVRLVHQECRASVGQVSFAEHQLVHLGKQRRRVDDHAVADDARDAGVEDA